MSYFIAGTSAFLSSLCYSEYAVEFPVAGGSFTFILYTFGEFWAWITATNLIFNYGAPRKPQSPVVALRASGLRRCSKPRVAIMPCGSASCAGSCRDSA